MVDSLDNWRVSRQSRDMHGRLFHELVVGQVTYLPDIAPLRESGISADHERETLRIEQQLFLQAMAAMEDLEGDIPPAIDLRIAKPANSGVTPQLMVGVVGRVTSRDAQESEDYARLLWRRFSTAFPRNYGFQAPSTSAPGFLETILPARERLQQASIWELVKEQYPVYWGGRFVNTIGTYSELLDSMTVCWDAIARSPHPVLLSIRFMPIPSIEVEKIEKSLTTQYKNLEEGSQSPDTPLLIDAQRRFDNLLSSSQLLQLRIQIVSWHEDPLAIKAAIHASLTSSLDTRQRSCKCNWYHCTRNPDSELTEQILRELSYVQVEKRELDEEEQRILPKKLVDSYRVPNYDLVTVPEVSAAWRFPLARRYEIAGIPFRRDPLFTQEPWRITQNASTLLLGTAISRASDGNLQYIETSRLTRHVLVMGEPGAGKSTTTQSLVYQLWRQGIPSLIIDPVSTEYRELWALSPQFGSGMDDPSQQNKSLCVFTPGAEGDAGTALSFNPFCPQPGISLNMHIMTLKSCFASAFGFSESWKELIGRAIRGAYQACGWPTDDTKANRQLITNEQLEQRYFPTIVDFIKAVEREIARYHNGEFRSNTEAGLLGRLRDLSVGPLGTIIQTRQRLNVEKLLNRPVVIELNKIGEADATSLIMLFLLTQLRQYYDTRPRSRKLEHFLIVEEAHRLLAPTPVQTDAPNNSRVESITLFINMLAELRKVGIGMMMVEQLPTRLEQNIVKLPGTKILHRLSARDDRELIASAMNMSAEQTNYVATLSTGEAAIFTEGLTEPILLQMVDPWLLRKTLDPSLTYATRPFDPDEQEILERDVEAHTIRTWSVSQNILPWDLCQICRCECRPRLKLLETDWWRNIKLDDIVDQASEAFSTSDKALQEKLVPLVATHVQQVTPKTASENEQWCALTLGLEYFIQQKAKTNTRRAYIQQMELIVETLLRYINRTI